MMAPSYRKADAAILALIESLILNYVQQVIFLCHVANILPSYYSIWNANSENEIA